MLIYSESNIETKGFKRLLDLEVFSTLKKISNSIPNYQTKLTGIGFLQNEGLKMIGSVKWKGVYNEGCI